MEKSLSYDQIKKIFSDDVYLVTAKDKAKMYFLSNASIKPFTSFVIHYQTSNEGHNIHGHWVCLVICRVTREVFFFDSYGAFPDDSLNKIPSWYRKETEQNQRDVGNFMCEMASDGYILHYSQYRLQKLKSGVNTCGRWVGLFLKCCNEGMDELDFFDFIKFNKKKYKLKDYDSVAIFLTQNVI